MQEGSQTDPLGYTQTRPICSLWFICDDRRDFEVPSQASNCLSIAQIADPFRLHQAVYTGHYEFPLKASKQELTLFTVKTFPLAQSSILRQHRGLGEQPHHYHHLLLSECHWDLTPLMAMPYIQSAATVRNTCFWKSISFFSHKLSVPWFLPSFPPNHFPSKSAAGTYFTSSGHFIWYKMLQNRQNDIVSQQNSGCFTCSSKLSYAMRLWYRSILQFIDTTVIYRHLDLEKPMIKLLCSGHH